MNANVAIEVRSYTRSAANPDVANPTGTTIITVPHPGQTNHNGGTVAFEPDGYLYVSIGDAAAAATLARRAKHQQPARPDPAPRRQRRCLPRRRDTNYAIPSDNPFVGQPGADEISAYGLRNPWRFSFDSATGDLYIGDLSPSAREEIDFQPAGTGGLNSDRPLEGSLLFEGPDSPAFVDPIFAYARTFGQSVTGGYVYHGP